jgi:hypothetical protein
MRAIVKFVVVELVAAAVIVALISMVYIFVLPRYFDDRRTYSVLIAGLALAVVVSGNIAWRTWEIAPSWRWSLSIAISVAVTAVVLVLSLFVILGLRGFVWVKVVV